MRELFEQLLKSDSILLRIIGWGTAGGAFLCFIALLLMVFRARSNPLRWVAILAMLCADATMGAGIVTTWRARQTTDAAAQALTPAKAEHVRHDGYIDAGSTTARVLLMGGIPLVFSLIALRVGGQRRWSEEHDGPPIGPAIPGLLVVFGVLSCGAAALLWLLPLQGRKMDDTAWRILELRDALAANQWQACLAADLSAANESPAHDMKERLDAQTSCAKHYADPSLNAASADLEKLLQVHGFEDPAARKLVQKRLDELAAKEATDKETAVKTAAAAPKEVPEPPPDPALSQVQTMVADCYRKAKKSKALPTAVRVGVARSGKVVDVRPADGSKPPSPARKCLVTELKAVSFAPGDERTLDVPILLPRK